ncbi:MAG TPA: hypothetical protein VFC44_24555 [Candidatus Saccharimonadales bacterium]|nr:hypothetical protein [Candidatus Saccharimonadales bacterium]
MNRSILIVICDFLLISLLAFSTVDINQVASPTAARGLKLDMDNTPQTNQASGRQDLGDVMRLALEDERKNRDALSGELSKTRNSLSQQQALLNQREQQLGTFQQQLRTREEQAARLQAQQTNLLGQMADAQTHIQNLNQQLHASTVETVITKEERAAMEAEARQQLEKAKALSRQLASLEKSNQLITAQREQLANQLQLTEAEKRAATAQLAQMSDEVNAQRQENAKLAEGVKSLASKSSELVQEIRENRALAPNTIFNQFTTNRVMASFSASRNGFFGTDSTKTKQTETILATDGTNTFAVCHVQDTPLRLGDPGTQWEELTGTLARGASVFSIDSLSFYLLDPRIVLMPVSSGAARELGAKVYHLSNDPFKFQDAVLVGAREGYYGECKFEIDLTAPQYLKMDHNSLKGLFGKFNPSSGDLVFSKTGELLGVMANSTYCVMLHHFEAAATFRFGPGARNQQTAETLSALYSTVAGLPYKLQ